VAGDIGLSNEFQDQGGVAGMDPSPPVRFLSSRVMSRMASGTVLEKRRQKFERNRQKTGAPHRVEYFHQVDDGYSLLAVQLLRPFLAEYEVDLVCHLVTAEQGRNLPEPELLLDLSRHDSAQIAPHYGVTFPDGNGLPDPSIVQIALGILANTPAAEFSERAVEVGQCVFAGDDEALARMAEAHGRADQSVVDARVTAGNERRTELGHYSGAMFFYGGEWYWGVDRFYHLEKRLMALGVRPGGDSELICPRPDIEFGPARDEGTLTLEVYPSLRSPYTSMIFDHTVRLAAETGVRLDVRPVLPMVMRGVPATRAKGRYIMSDTAREARALGLKWGKIYDPIGQPVRNAYALYPWACERGKGIELLGSFMHAAFFDGVNTNNQRGMKVVVERAGLPWDEAVQKMGDPASKAAWEEELEKNRLAMYGFGSWGVPSFRLLDEEGAEVLGLWGQDRLWLFSREIQRLLGGR